VKKKNNKKKKKLNEIKSFATRKMRQTNEKRAFASIIRNFLIKENNGETNLDACLQFNKHMDTEISHDEISYVMKRRNALSNIWLFSDDQMSD